MNDKQTHELLREIIREEMKAEGLYVQPWHHGKIAAIISPTKLKVFVDGSDIEQTISCSKNEPYAIGDEVWVVYINNSPRNKFVFGLRGVDDAE